MASFELQVSGLDKLIDNLDRLMAETPQEVAGALYEEANIEMTEAKQRCPVAPDGGTLRASGFVNDPEIAGNDISVTMGFGGAASRYALAVHEHPSQHSPPSWRGKSADEIHWNVAGTGPKFLEGPLLESAPYLADRLAKRMTFRQMVR